MLPSLPRPGRASSAPPKFFGRSGRGLPFRRSPAQLVGQRLAGRSEIEADRIDAVALAGERRPVGKDMALVPAAARADDLGAGHAVARVADIFQMVGAERAGEARPAGAALELGSAM